MNSHLVTIIIPCYNQAPFLAQALESVLAQTYSKWECVIVNDGSHDNTEELALEYLNKDPRFKYLKKPNGGLSSARNAGIEISTGDLILPLDADDLIGPEYLELAEKCFSKNENLTLVYCDAKTFGLHDAHWELDTYNFQNLLLYNHIFCSAIYRRQEWAKVGGYDEHLKNGFEDWAFWLKILNESSLVFRIPKILFYYRIKETSLFKDMKDTDKEAVKWHIYNSNIPLYEKFFDSPITILIQNNKQSSEIQSLKSEIQKIKNSNSYKIGNYFLRPVSFLKNKMK